MMMYEILTVTGFLFSVLLTYLSSKFLGTGATKMLIIKPITLKEFKGRFTFENDQLLMDEIDKVLGIYENMNYKEMEEIYGNPKTINIKK